jgi:two-component system OmpR family sensor kinase
MSSEPDHRFRTPLSRLPIRLRLATAVALVAFVILTVISAAVGLLTAHKLRSDFEGQVTSDAQNVANNLRFGYGAVNIFTNISDDVIRFYDTNGTLQGQYPQAGTPNLGSPFLGTDSVPGYSVATVQHGGLLVQVGVPTADLQSEIGRLELLLALGVAAGTILAFGAGSLVARRAIMPIAELTAAAAEIERTRDPSGTLPEPTADDEVAELTRTLEGMLSALADARNETEALLARQRTFVADASHELRTPLTSVLANLELLADSLEGPDRDAALSALRSTQRMRRLVGDLLLLARADGQRPPLLEPVDLAEIVIEAASELEPVAGKHVLTLDVNPAPTLGSRDDLQRVATNLIENALRHTPPGTHVTASTRARPDGGAELVVADDGPGVAPDVRATLFQRFVRGAGDRGGSFGLGLAIVEAVTHAHGGQIAVDESPHGGARFTVTLPPPAGPAVGESFEGRLWADHDIAAPDESRAEQAGERYH